MLEGRDVLAQSQTGTGKTAAFALPILSRIELGRRKPPQVLVLAPTRELAIQVTNSFSTYAACMPEFAVAAIYGGQDYEPQLRQLRRGVHVVVGTPGRVIDHIRRGTLDLSGIECLVLDEADEMLNMGFLEDVQFVLKQVPEKRQIALFSATLPGPIRDIAQQYLNDPVKITIKKKTMTADSIRQRALFVTPARQDRCADKNSGNRRNRRRDRLHQDKGSDDDGRRAVNPRRAVRHRAERRHAAELFASADPSAESRPTEHSGGDRRCRSRTGRVTRQSCLQFRFTT